MTFSQGLKALGAALAPPEEQWGDPDVPTAELCPRLRTTYSPRAAWDLFKGFGEQRACHSQQWARCWLPEPPAEALGLSIARNSDTPPRYGLKGLPNTGRKAVSRALTLLEEQRARLAFWTISLPTEALSALNRLDSWATFQDRLRRELVRALKRAGLPPLVVGVAELQPKRSHVSGFACPHLHVVFVGRKSRWARWALTRDRLDELIRMALASAGVTAPERREDPAWLRSAGNVQQVRRSVRAYLGKYMTKGSSDVARWVGSSSENLLPRQWWFWSEAMRALVLAHVFPIAFPFLLWAHENRAVIEEAGLARWRLLPLSDPRAPATYEVNWLKLQFLAELACVWTEDAWQTQWEAQTRLDRHYGRLGSRIDSQPYQQL